MPELLQEYPKKEIKLVGMEGIPVLTNPNKIVAELLDYVSHAIASSSDLFKHNVTDELSKHLYDMITQPKLVSVYSMFDKFYQIAKDELNKIIIKFFVSNKEIISKVFLVKSDDVALRYCIILKNDTIKNRSCINNFLVTYLNTPLEKHFPISFEYLPSDLISNLKDIPAGEITLN